MTAALPGLIRHLKFRLITCRRHKDYQVNLRPLRRPKNSEEKVAPAGGPLQRGGVGHDIAWGWLVAEVNASHRLQPWHVLACACDQQCFQELEFPAVTGSLKGSRNTAADELEMNQ